MEQRSDCGHNNHVEHFLNGKKVVDYMYGTDEWKAMVAKSKFADWAYATPHAKGHIALQNHSPKERVWYRDIKSGNYKKFDWLKIRPQKSELLDN